MKKLLPIAFLLGLAVSCQKAPTATYDDTDLPTDAEVEQLLEDIDTKQTEVEGQLEEFKQKYGEE